MTIEQEKQFLELMRELFPWWDYSNLYKLISMWMYEASSNVYNNPESDHIPKELMQGVELCDLISKEFDDDGYIISTEDKMDYIEQLGTLLKDRSLSWWD